MFFLVPDEPQLNSLILTLMLSMIQQSQNSQSQSQIHEQSQNVFIQPGPITEPPHHHHHHADEHQHHYHHHNHANDYHAHDHHAHEPQHHYHHHHHAPYPVPNPFAHHPLAFHDHAFFGPSSLPFRTTNDTLQKLKKLQERKTIQTTKVNAKVNVIGQNHQDRQILPITNHKSRTLKNSNLT